MHSRLTHLLLLGLAAAAVAGPPAPAAAADPRPANQLYGRVTVRGRNLPPGRSVRVEASTSFPLFGAATARGVAVNRKGEFTIDKLADGFYWVVAYIDDDKDGRRSAGEICGFPRVAPVFAGPDHRRVRVPIELDVVHAVVATRFVRGSGKAQPARLELAFAALYARHPATGAPLPDAQVTLEEDGRTRELAWDPTFPGGAHVAYGAGQPAAERFVFLVSHPALGKAKRRVALHARTLGTEPVISPTLPAAPPAGEDLVVEWRQPSWANFATVELFEPGPAGPPQRVWPEGLGGAVSHDGRAVIPAAVLTPGRRLRVDVVAGRADVRTENGQIWATAVAGRELVVGPRRVPAPGTGAPPAKGPTAPAKGPTAPAKGPTAPAGAPAAAPKAGAPAARPATGSRP
jgi:hypothetical protein